MKRGFKLHNNPITELHNPRNSQSGYMLIVLMVMVAMATLAMLAVYPDMTQQIHRDQEEEMCHRGTEYMRAIQHFYKKFGRYPTRIEELENTNSMRFLRKRYKDPMAYDQQGKAKDFKLLHMQDVNLGGSSMMGGMPGMMPGGGNPLAGNPNAQALNALGGAGGAQTALNALQQQGGAAANVQNNSGDDEPEGSPTPQGTPNPSGSSGFNTGGTTGTGLNNTVFGGGPILGVASTSKAKTIREFNKKNHYNDWMFIYDPTSDRGGLLVGPWQIPNTQTLPGATPAGQLTPGAQQPQGLGTPFGQQSSGFGAQQPQPQNSPQQQ
jgi:type II secretory pathway pseudopilin PulG